MKIRKRAGEHQTYVQPVFKDSMKAGLPKNRTMETAVQDTYASTSSRRARSRSPVRTRSMQEIHSSGTRLPESFTHSQFSSARPLVCRTENDGSSPKRAGKQPSSVQPAPIGSAAESRDYSSQEEISVSEAQEQQEGLPKNLRRRETALQDTPVLNARVPKPARTHSLEVTSGVPVNKLASIVLPQ